MFFKPLSFLLTSILFCCLFSLSSLAQPAPVHLIAPTLKAEKGETVAIPVKVVNFTNVVSAQFSMRFDTSVLKYVSIPSNFGINNIIPDYFATPFNSPDAQEAILFAGWTASNILQGETLTDSTVLFTVNFEVIGEVGEIGLIEFSSDPTLIEFGNALPPPDLLETELINGSVTVYDPVSVREVETTDFRFEPITPNPASDHFQVRFSLYHKAQTYLSIYDLSGKEIFRTTFNLGSGSHTIAIDTQKVPAPGTYLVQLATTKAAATQRLVVVR